MPMQQILRKWPIPARTLQRRIVEPATYLAAACQYRCEAATTWTSRSSRDCPAAQRSLQSQVFFPARLPWSRSRLHPVGRVLDPNMPLAWPRWLSESRDWSTNSQPAAARLQAAQTPSARVEHPDRTDGFEMSTTPPDSSWRDTADLNGLMADSFMTIVGVIGDVKAAPTYAQAPAAFYPPIVQNPTFGTYVALRATSNAAALIPAARQLATQMGNDLSIQETRPWSRSFRHP